MQDLTEVTQDVHYENYRSERLAKNGGSTVISSVATSNTTSTSSINGNGNGNGTAKTPM